MNTVSDDHANFVFSGACPICQKSVTFSATNPWFRDFLSCSGCGSVPRERALMLVLQRERPNWRDLAIHESSPAERAASLMLKRYCRRYVATQFFPNVEPGSLHHGYRCENLERSTFQDGSFDVVITQDVMEHVFDPASAYRDISRTLKPGGIYIHTVPIYKEKVNSERRARLVGNQVEHIFPPEYHGNPIDQKGSLVTYHYGYDLHDLIASWTPFSVEITRFNDREHGIIAEFSEVVVCRKQRRGT
ncbi:methyltransferase domain-containing protein [Bradyrhizobium sp. STM 3562]|uniref:methyltransferase domain-containing protein n=1 Tax=Bradyrhizobium sp. STM 3562 TaxID=578924 RepID=UPI00388E1072